MPESAPGTIGHITLEAKLAGERCAGKPHAPFDEAGAGNGHGLGTAVPAAKCVDSAGPTRPPRQLSTLPDRGRRGDQPSLPGPEPLCRVGEIFEATRHGTARRFMTTGVRNLNSGFGG